jgi:DNA-binding NarL/FixJ family response regulator
MVEKYMAVTLQVVIKNEEMGHRLAHWLKESLQQPGPYTPFLQEVMARPDHDKCTKGTPSDATPRQKRTLTRREIEVLELLGTGLPVKMVADRLGLSVHTVNQHLRQIYQKLDVHNRVAALNQGRRLGLLSSARG